jgi:hypothetical protein
MYTVYILPQMGFLKTGVPARLVDSQICFSGRGILDILSDSKELSNLMTL